MPCQDNDLNLCACKPEVCDLQMPIPKGCNIVFKDGVYHNATIYVENGCIVKIEDGIPFVYDPQICCNTTNNGCACDLNLQSADGTIADCGCGCGEGNFNKGEKGDPGESVEISVGVVQTVSAAEKAEVWLSGTTTKPVLNFKIPQGTNGVTPTVDNNAIAKLVKDMVETENGGIFVTDVQGAESNYGLIVETKRIDGGIVTVQAKYNQQFLQDVYSYLLIAIREDELNAIKQRLTVIEQRLNITSST